MPSFWGFDARGVEHGRVELRAMQLILPMAVPPPELDDIEFHDPNCWASTGEVNVVESLSSLHDLIFWRREACEE